MAEALLGFGGNVGDVRTTLNEAVTLFADGKDVTLRFASSHYLTPPWGVLEQPRFTNMAIVVDTALSLPDSAKLGDVSDADPFGQTYRQTGAKRVLIDVGKRWLPPEFDAQRKRGFAMPFTDWLRGSLHDVLHDTLDPRVVHSRGLLEASGVASIRDRFDRREVGWAEPWLLMMLELWCREVLDQSGRHGKDAEDAQRAGVVGPSSVLAAVDGTP